MDGGASDATQAQVVRLPAGTTIPINVDINGDVLDGTTTGTLIMRLSEDLELIVKDNKPQSRFRVGEGEWKHRRYNYRIRDFKREISITREEGPRIDMQMRISTNN